METYYCATCYSCVKDYNEEKDCCLDCSKYTNVNENPYWCKHRHKSLATKFYTICRNGLLGKEEIAFEWLCGNSIINVRKYLEEKFAEKMTWENYGDWHIDHIRPVSSFDLLQNKEIRKCWHYTNFATVMG